MKWSDMCKKAVAGLMVPVGQQPGCLWWCVCSIQSFKPCLVHQQPHVPLHTIPQLQVEGIEIRFCFGKHVSQEGYQQARKLLEDSCNEHVRWSGWVRLVSNVTCRGWGREAQHNRRSQHVQPVKVHLLSMHKACRLAAICRLKGEVVLAQENQRGAPQLSHPAKLELLFAAQHKHLQACHMGGA
jgi:hypothetical protein